MAINAIKYDPNTGIPILWQDDQTGKLFIVDQNGQTIEVDQYGRQVHQMQQPMIPSNQNNGYYNQQAARQQQQQPSPMASIGSQNPQTQYPTTSVGVNGPSSYKGRVSKPAQTEPNIPNINLDTEEKQKAEPTFISLIEYEPEPGSELEPLIDTDEYTIDLMVIDNSKMFKFMKVKKG